MVEHPYWSEDLLQDHLGKFTLYAIKLPFRPRVRLIAPFSMRREANFVLTILIAVFEYNSGAHNVVEVGGPDFLSCTKPANAVVWNSGEDRVTLDKAGRRWFFCAVGQHCQNGMKLKITVLVTAAPTPQPAPAPFA